MTMWPHGGFCVLRLMGIVGMVGTMGKVGTMGLMGKVGTLDILKKRAWNFPCALCFIEA